MDTVDSHSKPGTFAPGSISPAGASSSSASGSSSKPRVVVWCATQEKFLPQCTEESLLLPACACTPMVRYLSDGQMGRIAR